MIDLLSHICIVALVIFATVVPVHAENRDVTNLLKTFESINQSNFIQCGPVTDPGLSKDETSAWITAGFRNPEIKSIDIRPTSDTAATTYTHEFDLSLVMFKGSGWSEELVRSSITRVSEIYRQCGIRVGKAKLVMIEPPNDWIDITLDRDRELAKMTPHMSKPTLYFVRSSLEGYTAYAWDKSGCSRERCDTAWITNDINSAAYKRYRDSNYSPIAHEIAHLLGNCDHIKNDSKNILGNSASTVNDQIMQDQCESFKKHESMRKL